MSKTNKSLKGNLKRSPPKIYILLPSTQAVCPSLGSGISPLILTICSFIFSFSSFDNIFNPSLILSGLEVKINVFLILTTLGRHRTCSAYFPSASLLLFLSCFFSCFLVVFLFLSIFTFFTFVVPCWLFFIFSFFFFLSFSFSISASLLYELKLGFVLFSTSLLVNHLNFFSSFLFSADILLSSSLVNCSNKVSWTHSYSVRSGMNFHISLLSLINPVFPPKIKNSSPIFTIEWPLLPFGLTSLISSSSSKSNSSSSSMVSLFSLFSLFASLSISFCFFLSIFFCCASVLNSVQVFEEKSYFHISS